MGREAVCTVRVDGKGKVKGKVEVMKGRALLETGELSFRGAAAGQRLRIPLAEIRWVEEAAGALTVAHRGGVAVFDLGAEAPRWRDLILNPPSRVKKLGLRAGMKVAVLGRLAASDLEEIAEAVGQRPRAPEGGEDLVFVAVEKKGDLGALGKLAGQIDPDGAIWVVRRKGKEAPVSEAESMAAGKTAGLVDTKVVSFSETHTAERYVIPVAKRGREGVQKAQKTQKTQKTRKTRKTA